MRTPLAIHNLLHQSRKTLVSVGGVAFALLLVFMQLGFMGAVSDTAANVLQRLEFDLLLRARDYLHLYEPGSFDRKWLAVAENTHGVRSAKPFWITIHNWRTLPSAEAMKTQDFEFQYRPIAVMAHEAQNQVFKDLAVEGSLHSITGGSSILLDDSTQQEYGPLDGRRFGPQDLRRTTEIGGKQFAIEGLFKLGTGLAANGAVIMSDAGFARIMPLLDTQRRTSLGLIQLDSSNPMVVTATAEQIRERCRLTAGEQVALTVAPEPLVAKLQHWLGKPQPLASGLPLNVMTKAEAIERERYRWLWQTPIGLIFQLGVVLSLFVGAAIVYMVLSTDVANRLPEYATLLAMGYSRTYLAGIVMTQALVLCGLGFIFSWVASEILYRITSNLSSIPLSMTGARIIQVGVLGVIMCCVSGLLALRKLWKAEPANLF